MFHRRFPSTSSAFVSVLSSVWLLAIATTACSPSSVTLAPTPASAPTQAQASSGGTTTAPTTIPNRVARNANPTGQSTHSTDKGISSAPDDQSGDKSGKTPISASAPSDEQAIRPSEMPSDRPEVASLTNTVNGDLMCYVTLVDKNGKTFQNLGATFEACKQPNSSFNRPVKLIYGQVSVSDCQSAEPCGKTRQATLITEMKPVDAANPRQTSSYTLSNNRWKVTIGNMDSWSGVSGTGDLSYYGCDDKNQCLDLVGGQLSYRNGMAQMSWRNGNYAYVIEHPMENPEAPNQAIEATLTVLENDQVILQETGLRKIQ